jgi:glycosyltransferase involved in cell wall biosynthesis
MVRKLVFFLPSLEGGGAERNVINFLRRLDKNKYDITLVLAEKKGVFLGDVPYHVRIISLESAFSFIIFIKIINFFKKEKPDIFVSTFARFNLINLLAKIFSGQKFVFIIMEQTTPSKLFLTTRKFFRKIIAYFFLPHLIRFFYPKAQAIVCVSEGVRKDLYDFSGIKSGARVIYNPVLEEKIFELAREETNCKWFSKNSLPVILAVGRLVKAKNYDLLLKAFSLILEKKPSNLVIVGEGSEKNNLIKLCRRLGISKNVCFLGFQKNPYKFLAKSSVFAVSSVREGFSNAIIEAMACSCPVVAAKCPGPEEIIKDSVSGILFPVGNEKFLAESVLKILNNPVLSINLSEAGKLRAQFFTVEKSIKEYEKLFDEFSNK